MQHLIPLRGTIQHYAWGGYDLIPKLLNIGKPDEQPYAELWMGTHPKGPAEIVGQDDTLTEFIAGAPSEILGKQTAERFDGKLPFLLKVLDVRQMLSIQVHPNKAQAEEGFAREEKNGPPRDAPDRNYRDDNHKPELGVAVTDFYLLHGFRSQGAIRSSLQELPGWESLLPHLDEGGVSGLYAHVMHAEQEEIDRLLTPLADALTAAGHDAYRRDDPRFWARRAVEQYTEDEHHDRGMFSIFWFNLVHLRPGQGIFQDAGIPHAYLEGACIELMANSDNVLRGGLTPKHIDVPELLDKISFAEVDPRIISPAPAHGPWTCYPTPVPDFQLYTVTPRQGNVFSLKTDGKPGILLLMEGGLSGGEVALNEGCRVAFATAGTNQRLTATHDAEVYFATVGDYGA